MRTAGIGGAEIVGSAASVPADRGTVRSGEGSRRRLAGKGAGCSLLAIVLTLVALAGHAGAITVRDRILGVAAGQLGYSEPGNYCSKFGPCEEWCSLFATWVWEQAGVAVPRLGFVGDLYDWAQAMTYVEDVNRTPTPGDAVLFGTGPENVDTSLHAGIVEDVYRTGYLVTIEGDVIHGVRRFVVPIDDPQRVGEPGPIYAYASPVGRVAGRDAAASAFAPPLPAAPLLDHTSSLGVDWPAVNRRQRRTIRSLRAFQHMPYSAGNVRVDWTGVDRRGLVEVRVRSAMHMSRAREAWQAFLRRFHDSGRAYVVTVHAPPDAPVDRHPPSISGTATEGQAVTVSDGAWSNHPTSYTHQWEDCDSSGLSCSAIAGATGQTYTLTASDVGDTIRVEETASNAGGPGQPATSIPTTVVASPPPLLQPEQSESSRST